jgi:hypothetical protein
MTSSRPSRPRPAGSPFSDPVPAVIETFEVGDRVTHDKQGLGRVVSVQPDAVVVDFSGRELRVLSPFSKLSKL